MKKILTTLMLGTAALATGAAAEPVKNIVLVHGAFADETSWDAVAKILTADGYAVTQVANPLSSLADDVAATRAALDAVNGPAVLVGHSWGGVVIGEAGNHPNVAAMVYVSAFAPDRGESLNALLGNAPPSEASTQFRPDATGGLIFNPETFPKYFAPDVPAEMAAEMALHQIPLNPEIFATPSEVAAWHDHKVSYVVTLDDQLLPADVQRMFAGRMDADVTEIKASHAGLVSQAEAVAKAIEAAAQ